MIDVVILGFGIGFGIKLLFGALCFGLDTLLALMIKTNNR